MMKLTKCLVLLCAASPLSALHAADSAATGSVSRPSARASDLFTNSIVAKARGDISISRSQLDEALIGIKTRAAAQGQSIPPEMLANVERQVLQRLIQVKLLNARASEAQKATAKELAVPRLAELKTRAGSETVFNQQLQSVGLTPDELLAKMTEELTAETVLKSELKVTVTDEDIKKFYEENPGQFEQPELVRAAHILLMTVDPVGRTELTDEKKDQKKKVAEDVLKRARAGEDFARLAKEYSEDPGSKDEGGEYVFSRGEMVPEFSAAAFSMETNQISDIVTTQFGYHIIKFYEKSPARKAALDDDVVFLPPPKRYLVARNHWIGRPELTQASTNLSAMIRESLESQELQKLIPDFMEKLEDDAGIEILDERLKPTEDAAMTPPATGDPQ